MARVRGFTALLQRYQPLPAFASGRTGEGTIYPFDRWNVSDPRWDLFAAFCYRVSAWRYTFNNAIAVSYSVGSTITSYNYATSVEIEESALAPDAYRSDTFPGDLAGAAFHRHAILSTPPEAAQSEKVFAHPFTIIARGSSGTGFGSTGSYSVDDGVTPVGGSLDGFGQSVCTVSPCLDDPVLDTFTGKLTRGPCFKTDNWRYLGLQFSGQYADNRDNTALGFNPGESTFTSPDGSTGQLRYNILIASLIHWPGYRQVGSLTINWLNWRTGDPLQVTAPLYAPDPTGSSSVVDPSYSGVSVAHQFNVTMEPAEVLPYGRDPEDRNAFTTENAIWDPATGERLKWPLGPR